MPQTDTLDNVAYACMLVYPIVFSHLSFNFLCLLLLYSIYLGASTLSYSFEGSPALAVSRPSLSLSCLKLTTVYQDFFATSFLYSLLVTLTLKKHLSSIGLEIGPNNAFIAYRTPLPSASYSAGQVWLPPGRL